VRIVYLSTSALPSRAANSVHVMRMCAALTRAGHDVTLVARDSGVAAEEIFRTYGVPERYPIELVSAGGGRSGMLAYPLRVRKRLKELGRPDLIYGRHLHSLVAVAGMGVPMVYEVHALTPRPDWMRARRLSERPAERRLLRRPSMRRVVTISQALATDFLQVHGRTPSRTWDVVIAHDAADPIPGVPRGPEGENPIRVGYVGGLYEGRGIDLIEQLARRLPDLEFHVAGGADDAVAALRGRTAELDNFVTHGFLRPAEVAEMLSGFDILLAPYQERIAVAGNGDDTVRWMSPLKIFEYMATGRAIVCSDLTVLREVLEDGETARLVPAGDVAAWADAVRALASDEGERARLGEAALRRFSERHTWTARAEAVLAGLEIECAA
jgi:glycosyltransferase involved in cell wall biosynthesis